MQKSIIFMARKAINELSIYLPLYETDNWKIDASSEIWTHDPWFTRPVLCHWAIEAHVRNFKKLEF